MKNNATGKIPLIDNLSLIQEKIGKQKEDLNHCRVVLGEKVRSRDVLRQSATPKEELSKKDALMQAEIALGKFDEKEHQKIKAEMISNDEIVQEIRTIDNLIDGISMKKAEAEKGLADLESEYKKVMEEFLREEAEKIGVEYMVCAKELLDNFRRIQAIGELHRAVNPAHKQTIADGNEYTHISIPVFKLESCQQNSNNSERWPIWNASYKTRAERPHYIKGDIATAMEVLSAAGLPWPFATL